MLMGLDKNTRNMVRPFWTKLVKFQEHENDYASYLFGPGSTAQGLREAFDLKIEEFGSWWVEVSKEQAIPGDSTPARVEPILAIRQTKSKRFVPERKSLDGFVSRDGTEAWIRTQDWEDTLGDTTFQEIEAKADRIRRNARKLISGKIKTKIRRPRARK
jgi:hypothetical protein